MRDETGRILIKGFYDDVRPPTAAEKEALSKIPNVEADLLREFEISSTEGNGKPLNELLMLPGLNLRGIESGRVGEKASNTIPTEARASIDFRLVPNETPESIKPLVERHLEAQGYTIVRQTARHRDPAGETQDCESRVGPGLLCVAHPARSSFLARTRPHHDCRRPRTHSSPYGWRKPTDGFIPTRQQRSRHRLPHRESRR